mmetsp:Transcript_62937/g.187615  ORF Transcript_62937/g.187615 Transcript_62937/m.187615 type:complete len:255 (-) Transcript_62937:136-900(-)
MAGMSQTLPEEPVAVPVKNTFVHFAADSFGPVRCRSRSEPAAVGRVSRSSSSGRPGRQDECEGLCPTLHRTYTARSTAASSCSDEIRCRRSSSGSDTESTTGDEGVVAEQREMMVAQRPDANGVTRVSWKVEAERMQSSEHKVSSPVFLLAVPGFGWCSFQLILYAHNRRKVLTFEQAEGQGRVELKCLDDLPPKYGKITYNTQVGTLPPRGWVVHDFSRVVQRSERRLDFAALADPSTQTLAVEVCFAPAVLA